MKIVYVYDALCGWCYGFSPVIVEFQEKYRDSLNFEVVSGGMVTGDRIGPIGEVASYISQAYKDVENATGVRFGQEFLSNTLRKGKAIFTSIPPAIALSVFKSSEPQNCIQFASALQRAIYFDGIEPKDLDAYGQIASQFDLEAASFVSKMNDPLFEEEAMGDFSKSADLGVSGFPTVFLENNGTYVKLARGYTPFRSLERNFLEASDKLSG